jgi:hypothetical protein
MRMSLIALTLAIDNSNRCCEVIPFLSRCDGAVLEWLIHGYLVANWCGWPARNFWAVSHGKDDESILFF